jgi:hypothetical protein
LIRKLPTLEFLRSGFCRLLPGGLLHCLPCFLWSGFLCNGLRLFFFGTFFPLGTARFGSGSSFPSTASAAVVSDGVFMFFPVVIGMWNSLGE